MFGKVNNFTELINERLATTPDKEIVRLLHNNKPDQVYTYADLVSGSLGYAKALDSVGTSADDIVVLLLPHGESLLFAYWGAVLHGAVPAILPFLTEKLSPDIYRRQIAALFTVTQPSAVITYTEFIPEVAKAVDESSNPVGHPIRILDRDNVTSENIETNLHNFSGIYRNRDDLVLLQHSSGTTGLQKGVALSHGAVFNQINSYRQALRLMENDRIISWLPLYHDMGLIAGFVLPVLTGTPLVLLSPFDWVRAPHRLLQAVSQFGGTLSWMPNFAYNFCAQKIRDRYLENVSLETWRAVINCSEPMYYQSHQLFLEKFKAYGLKESSLATCYAMAENVFAVTQGGITSPVMVDEIDASTLANEKRAEPTSGDTQSIKMLSAGKAIENTHIRILSEDYSDLPDRHVGEIAISSDCMLSEYYHRPEETHKVFQDDWYLTGDMGYLVEGELFVTGRKKDLIIVGGKNIYPQDLEFLANMVEGVYPGRVAAFGVDNSQTGTQDVVILAEAVDSLNKNNQERQSLANAIRANVTQGSDIALRYVEIVDRGWLIKTSSGKVSRTANKEKYLSQF